MPKFGTAQSCTALQSHRLQKAHYSTKTACVLRRGESRDYTACNNMDIAKTNSFSDPMIIDGQTDDSKANAVAKPSLTDTWAKQSMRAQASVFPPLHKRHTRHACHCPQERYNSISGLLMCKGSCNKERKASRTPPLFPPLPPMPFALRDIPVGLRKECLQIVKSSATQIVLDFPFDDVDRALAQVYVCTGQAFEVSDFFVRRGFAAVCIVPTWHNTHGVLTIGDWASGVEKPGKAVAPPESEMASECISFWMNQKTKTIVSRIPRSAPWYKVPVSWALSYTVMTTTEFVRTAHSANAARYMSN